MEARCWLGLGGGLLRAEHEAPRLGHSCGLSTPCGPARASLLTGLYMMNHRAVQNTIPLDSRFTNLGHELRRGGYDAALVGYTTPTPDPTQPSGTNLSIGAGSDGSSKADGTSYGSVRDGDMSTYWSPSGFGFRKPTTTRDGMPSSLAIIAIVAAKCWQKPRRLSRNSTIAW